MFQQAGVLSGFSLGRLLSSSKLLVEKEGLITERNFNELLQEKVKKWVGANHLGTVSKLSATTASHYEESVTAFLTSIANTQARNTGNNCFSEEEIKSLIKNDAFSVSAFFLRKFSQLYANPQIAGSPELQIDLLLQQLSDAKQAVKDLSAYTVPVELPIEKHTSFITLTEALVRLCFLHPEILKNPQFKNNAAVKELLSAHTIGETAITSALKVVLEHANSVKPGVSNLDTFAQLVQVVVAAAGPEILQKQGANSQTPQQMLQEAYRLSAEGSEPEKLVLKAGLVLVENGLNTKPTKQQSPAQSRAEREKAEHDNKVFADMLKKGDSVRSR